MASGIALPIVRMGVDICSGHEGFNPRPAISGSLTVFCNGIAIARMGDAWATHTDGSSAHQGNGAGGSPTVLCEGLPVMREFDPISCGSVAAAGSLDTFCG